MSQENSLYDFHDLQNTEIDSPTEVELAVLNVCLTTNKELDIKMAKGPMPNFTHICNFGVRTL